MADRPPGLINLDRYDFELSYSGFQTFLKLPVALTAEDLRAGQVDVAIGGIQPGRHDSSRTGTSLGPRGIRIADHQWTVGNEKYHLGVEINFFEHLRMADFGDAQVLHGAIELSFNNMKHFVAQIADGGAIPVIMGGDHAVSWPTLPPSPSITAMAGSVSSISMPTPIRRR